MLKKVFTKSTRIGGLLGLFFWGGYAITAALICGSAPTCPTWQPYVIIVVLGTLATAFAVSFTVYIVKLIKQRLVE